LAASIFCTVKIHGAEAAEPGAAELFSSLPGFADASISPSGTHLAVAIPNGAGDRLVIIRPGVAGAQPVVVNFGGLTINNVDWDSDERVIARVHGQVASDRQNVRFQNVFRAVALSADGTSQVRLMSRGTDQERMSNFTDRIIDLAPADPNHVYIEAYFFQVAYRLGSRGEGEFNVYRANLLDGTADRVASGRTDTARWIMDGEGNIAARIDIPRGRGDQIFAAAGGDFRQIATLNDRRDNLGEIQGLTEDGRSLAVLARRENDRKGLYRLDLATGAWGAPLFLNDTFDIASVLRDERTTRVTGVAYFDGELKFQYFAPQRQAIQRRLEEVLANRTVMLLSSSSDGMKHIVEASSPQSPPRLHLVDLASNRVETVAQGYAQLERMTLGQVQAVAYANSAGDRLTGQLTLPAAARTGPLPLVVVPAGFTGFAVGRFDWLAQFLANRGYAVLHAGTRDFKHLGDVSGMDQLGQWIAETQDDFSSGIRELAQRGIVDPARVCVLGSGFDGYLALASAVFSPDQYACAVSISGVTDLKEIIDAFEQGLALPAFVADSTLVRNSTDYADEDLDRYSPVNHVNSARAAFLLVHGEEGGWRSQSERMASLLRSAGKRGEYVEIENDDGRIAIPASRLRMLNAIEVFLASNLGR
jgi:dipeptidyl aminopeptidase/acylaminoacyl peptidase